MEKGRDQPIRAIESISSPEESPVREGASSPGRRAKTTDSRSPLERPHSLSRFPDQLQLLDHAGSFLRWVSPDKALELVDRCGAVLRGTKKKYRAVQLIREPDWSQITVHYKRDKQVHNHETWYNPRGVWTFRKAA